MNLIVRTTERVAYGYIDPRAVFATSKPNWWHTIWMAVSSCCGIAGPTEIASLPAPEPATKDRK